MVQHSSYASFTEPGFRGNYRIIRWHGDKCHVVITSDDTGDDPLEVVWMVRPGHAPVIDLVGQLLVIMKDFSRRQCMVKIMPCDDARMVWLLDEHPTQIE